MVSKKRNPHVDGRKHEIVRRMFVETGAKNYIVARWAFFNNCNIDFYWLSAQAIEKYFKAVLLHNGRSTSSDKHNLTKLLRAVLNLCPSIDTGPLEQPKPLRSHFHWRKESIKEFVHRVNKYGNPHNRYMVHGYVLHGDEVYKLDQLMWQLHRHCRPLKETVSLKILNLPDKTIKWAKVLKESKKSHQTMGLLEDLMRSKVKNQRGLRQAFLQHNFAFAPSTARCPNAWKMGFEENPFIPVFETLRHQHATAEDRQYACDVFQWAITNIFLSDEDKNELQNAIEKYRPQ